MAGIALMLFSWTIENPFLNLLAVAKRYTCSCIGVFHCSRQEEVIPERTIAQPH